jgi:hypothetical protein
MAISGSRWRRQTLAAGVVAALVAATMLVDVGPAAAGTGGAKAGAVVTSPPSRQSPSPVAPPPLVDVYQTQVFGRLDTNMAGSFVVFDQTYSSRPGSSEVNAAFADARAAGTSHAQSLATSHNLELRRITSTTTMWSNTTVVRGSVAMHSATYFVHVVAQLYRKPTCFLGVCWY